MVGADALVQLTGLGSQLCSAGGFPALPQANGVEGFGAAAGTLLDRLRLRVCTGGAG